MFVLTLKFVDLGVLLYRSGEVIPDVGPVVENALLKEDVCDLEVWAEI